MSVRFGRGVFAVVASAGALLLAVPAGATTCSTVSACVLGINTASGPGVEGESKTGFGLEGTSTSGTAILGTSVSGDGIDGKTSAASTSSANARSGLAGFDLSSKSTFNSGVFGLSANGTGIQATTGTGTGLRATATVSSGTAIAATAKLHAISAQVTADNGTAILGTDVRGSSQSAGVVGQTFGTGPHGFGVGVMALSDTNGTALGVSSFDGDGVDISSSSAGIPLYISGGDLYSIIVSGLLSLDSSGNLVIAGSLTQNGNVSLITHARGGQAVTAFTSRQAQATIEDVGEAQVINGAGSVALESTFASTIDPRRPYYVFLTPEGDNRGLFVAAKTPRGFVIHESMGGRSTLAVQYRIVASPYDSQPARLAAAPLAMPYADARERSHREQVRARLETIRANVAQRTSIAPGQ